MEEMNKQLGIFENIPIEGLDCGIEDEKAMSYTVIFNKDLDRILTQSCKKIVKDYGSKEDQYMVKDYKTGFKVLLFIRKDKEGRLFGYIYCIYPINYCSYCTESDNIKVIEQNLKKQSEGGDFLYYNYDDSFFKDFFEDGILYHTYETINLNKEKYNAVRRKV